MSELDSLIAQLCPDGVEYKTLGEVCLSTYNINWKKAVSVEYHYIDLTSVDRETHKINQTSIITSENAPSRAQKVINTDDVIFATTRPTLKRFCFIPLEYDGQICSTGYCVLRANPQSILPRFIYHAIGTTEFCDYVEANQQGTAYPSISDGDVKSFELPIPPLSIQREIVRILDNFTELQRSLQRSLQREKNNIIIIGTNF